jgi:hypothetical protein
MSRTRSEIRPNLGRHEYACKICAHKERDEIEASYVAWKSLREIETHFTVSKDTIHRHAHAMGLDRKRSANVRGALERVIEKGLDSAEINGSALVSALTALAKLTETGQLVDRLEISTELQAKLSGMSDLELENFAKSGVVPGQVPATASEGNSEENDGKVS